MVNIESVKMNIVFFAIAKDFFGSVVSIDSEFKDIATLKQYLISQKPESEKVILSSRFAVEMEFVSDEFIIENIAEIYVIPPSSGG